MMIFLACTVKYSRRHGNIEDANADVLRLKGMGIRAWVEVFSL